MDAKEIIDAAFTSKKKAFKQQEIDRFWEVVKQKNIPEDKAFKIVLKFSKHFMKPKSFKEYTNEIFNKLTVEAIDEILSDL
jgi:hypothetical protein